MSKTLKYNFRSASQRQAGVKAFSALYQPFTDPETAELAMEWMSFCDRTGRKNYESPI